MIVLGIDPGTAVMGYGVIRKDPGAAPPTLLECGVLRTKSRDVLSVRLAEIFDGVTELIERHKPDALSIEDVP